MENKTVNVQVHRFHDKVTVYIGNDQRMHLTPLQANKIANAIKKVSKSIRSGPYSTSVDTSFYFEFDTDIES